VTRVFSGSTAALAANFAEETAGIIGLSYFFHETGHHQLERVTPCSTLRPHRSRWSMIWTTANTFASSRCKVEPLEGR